MEYRLFSHRHAIQILENTPEYRSLYGEILDCVRNVTEERLIEHFQYNYESKGRAKKSISESINQLLKVELSALGWLSEAPIFRSADFGEGKWRLDFAKSTSIPVTDLRPYGEFDSTAISVEVGFNHSGSVAWNLLKPVLASELNHVEKAIQTSVGVIVTASRDLQIAGGFDNAIGVYEDYVSHLIPLRDVLSVPILVIGLEAPRTFQIEHVKKGQTTFGFIKMFES